MARWKDRAGAVLLRSGAAGAKCVNGEAVFEVSQVRFPGYSAIGAGRILGRHPGDVRTLAVPLPQLPGAILPLGRSTRGAGFRPITAGIETRRPVRYPTG